MKKDALPLSREQIANLSKDELVAYAEANEDCFCVRCICDSPHPEFCPSLGIFTKVIIPALSWWELQTNGKSEFRGIDPLPPRQLEAMVGEMKDSGAKFFREDRGKFEDKFFTPMSAERLKIETAMDEEICEFRIDYIGRVRDTAEKLRDFLEQWESESAKLERLKVEKKGQVPACLEKAFGVKNDPLVFVHAAACNRADNDPEGRDETLILRMIGREVVKRLRAGEIKFFGNLEQIAKSFSEKQNFFGEPNVHTARGKIILTFKYLVARGSDSLPSRSEILDELDKAGHGMDEKQFRDDCKTLGMQGLRAS